jgi:NADH-quinone oxidoreductase subunit E
MVNWEFFDQQTPASAVELVEDLRAGREVRPTRGPDTVHTFKEVSRVLAGFLDGHADEGVGAGPASLQGTLLAKRKGWTAPGAGETDGARAAAGDTAGDTAGANGSRGTASGDQKSEG